MTGFTEHEFQDSYSTSKNNLVAEFYEPVLSKAVRYDRSSGYFSSALMSLIPLGFADFISRGGKIRLICSPQLTQTDYEAIVNYGQEVDDVQTMLSNLRDIVSNSDPDKALLARVFSSLLASGVLEMRIAKTDLTGIFHDKVGIFEDENGKYISFIGSANETAAAWSGFVNHENLEVFNSNDSGDKRRVSKHISYFEDLWANRYSTVETVDVRTVEKEDLTSLLQSRSKTSLQKFATQHAEVWMMVPVRNQKSSCETISLKFLIIGLKLATEESSHLLREEVKL